MSRFFNPDNPIMEFIAKIFDLILFEPDLYLQLCSDPFTIGASHQRTFLCDTEDGSW